MILRSRWAAKGARQNGYEEARRLRAHTLRSSGLGVQHAKARPPQAPQPGEGEGKRGRAAGPVALVAAYALRPLMFAQLGA